MTSTIIQSGSLLLLLRSVYAVFVITRKE